MPLTSCMRKEGGQETSDSCLFGKISGEDAFGLFKLISSIATVSRTLRFLVCSRLNLSAFNGSGLLLIYLVFESRFRTRVVAYMLSSVVIITSEDMTSSLFLSISSLTVSFLSLSDELLVTARGDNRS